LVIQAVGRQQKRCEEKNQGDSLVPFDHILQECGKPEDQQKQGDPVG